MQALYDTYAEYPVAGYNWAKCSPSSPCACAAIDSVTNGISQSLSKDGNGSFLFMTMQLPSMCTSFLSVLVFEPGYSSSSF